MPQINTSITKLLNIDIPIIQAPMGHGGRGELTSAVTRAGAFGFIGAEFKSSQELKKDFALLRRDLNLKREDTLPVGVGFIGWILDSTESETSDDQRIPAILEEKPLAIWFAFGRDLGRYVARVREYDASRSERGDRSGHKTLIFVMVGSVEDAVRVAELEWGVDVIVAQGIEAGGHGNSDAPPLLTLLQGVLRALPGFPVVAAGGITTGTQVAALLTAGAAGVALGTRFLFTNETVLTTAQRGVILGAGLIDSTVRTLAFDEVGRTNGWPEGYNGRAIRNKIFEDSLEEGCDLDVRMRRYDESKAAGDAERSITWAGVGVGLVDCITPAEDVVRELQNETICALKKASSLLCH